jgi:hypothetical protein
MQTLGPDWTPHHSSNDTIHQLFLPLNGFPGPSVIVLTDYQLLSIGI